MIHKFMRYAAVASLVVLGLAGCERNLAVDNPNAGNTGKVLGTPGDAEALLGSYYKRWSSGVYGNTTDLEGMANVMSLMNFSSLANNCQNSHYPFTNASNVNTLGNTCQGEQYRLYSVLEEVTRVTSNIVAAMDSGLTLGISTVPATDARNLRARSYAEFLRGISLGYIAMMHDSAAIISPTMGTSAADCVADPITKVCTGALRYYTEVRDSALAALQRAIDYANPTVTLSGQLSDGFPLPSTWIPSPTSFTAAEFTKLIRSYRARIRANMARTPAERAAVDWAAVVADAQGGITADNMITTSTTLGPGNSWRDQYEAYSTWHQMPPFVIGMADQSGAYASWIGTPLGDRGAGNTGFIMVTTDKRFPQGATRAAQNSDFAINSCQNAKQACKHYFVNRSAGNDVFSGPGWGWSNYDFVRFHSWDNKGDAGSGRNGDTPFFTLSELNLLQAEGQYRLGNYAAACALVNISRTNGSGGFYDLGGGLPAITTCDATTPVPGGATNCIPKVPGFGTPAGDFTKVGCGNLWEALKYEKRIETAYTAYANWYLDMRGWGDLPENTATFWAVPFQELMARGKSTTQLYGAGPGVGNAANSVSGKSTYGW